MASLPRLSTVSRRPGGGLSDPWVLSEFALDLTASLRQSTQDPTGANVEGSHGLAGGGAALQMRL